MLNIEEIKAREQAAEACINDIYDGEIIGETAYNIINHALQGMDDLLSEVERLTKENESLAKNGGKYIEISQKRYEMFEKASKRAENAEIERDTLKKALTELIQTGQYNFCELCGADCIDAGLDFVDEMSQCGCFILRGIQQAQEGKK